MSQKNPMLKQMLHRSRIYPLVLIIIMLIVQYCRNQQSATSNKNTQKTSTQITGQTMGTIQYIVEYVSEQKIQKEEIDSLLKAFNQSLSTYIKDSEISTFNNTGSFTFQTPFFYPVLQKSKEVYELSEGYFDPTVMPLVKAWKFGPDKALAPEDVNVDSLMKFVGFNKVIFDETKVSTEKGVSLDFSAIAKGYAVDIIATYLLKKGIKDFMINIGGELVCYGKNAKNQDWLIGIQDPNAKTGNYQSGIFIKNEAIATSGNYYQNYVKDQKKIVHTIDPKTGYTKDSELLSATVIAKDCMTADALATGLMAMGKQKALEFAKQHPELALYLIYVEGEKVEKYVAEKLKGQFLEK